MAATVGTLPVGAPGVGVAGLDPTPEELAGLTTLPQVAAWAGLTDAQRDSLFTALGGPTHAREIAVFSRARWDTLGELPQAASWAGLNTPVVTGRIEIFRRVCRMLTGLTPGDPPDVPGLPATAQPVVPAGPVEPARAARVLKLSSVVDQTLESVVNTLEPAKVREMFRTYAETMGAEPSEAVEPSNDQLSALAQLLEGDAIPYVDFAIWCPHGRRMLAKMVFVAHALNPDGTWQRRELPGPPSFEAWWASWRVFRTAMLLLRAADAELLDNYAEMVRDFHTRYSAEVWFVLYTAEVRMRSERFERLRRAAENEHAKAQAAGRTSTFEPARPWNRVFADAVTDRDWWSENFTEPAVLYRTRIQTAAAVMDDGTGHDVTPRGKGAKRTAPAADPGAPPGKGGKRASLAPVWANGRYVKNRRGIRVCEAFNRGQCGWPTSACPRGEAHQCSLCLGAHSQEQCRSASTSQPGDERNPPDAKGYDKGKAGKGGKKGSK